MFSLMHLATVKGVILINLFSN